MARASWTGSLGFGLVNIGVALEPAVRPHAVHFHLFHDADGGRIREKRVCELDGKEVPYEHIVKGYELTKKKVVMVTRDELKAVDPKRDKVIAVEAFLELAAIDPVFFDRTYYVTPHGKGADRAYAVFAAALEESGNVALARMVMSTQQHLCIVLAKDGVLRLTTMAFGDEVMETPKVPHPSHSSKELEMAKTIIENMKTEFEPKKYHDTHRERVIDLIKHKAKGDEIELVEPRAPEGTTDLAEALKRSLEATAAGQKRTSTSRTRKPSVRKAARRRTSA